VHTFSGFHASQTVSEARINSTTKVLHIRPEAPSSLSADNFDDLLAAAPFQADTCEDVYRGLARLCRGGDEAPCAAIVCVDGLGPAELEFFSIASRTFKGVDVYVYGTKRSTDRIAKAIELGATGPATAEVIQSLAPLLVSPTPARLASPSTPGARSDKATPQTTAPTARPCVETPPTDATSERVAAIPDAPAFPLSDTPGSMDSSDHEGQDEPARAGSPARVPWLSYHDRPKRTAPRPRQPARDQPVKAEHTEARPSSHEPLLTEAELQALIGDDIAAIAPDEDLDAAGDDQKDRRDPS
jgi:hypothetical protein